MVATTPSARVLALLSQKGGSGKTTLAVHLAVALGRDRRVVLVDTDPQRSSARWRHARQTSTPELVEADAGQIIAAIREIRASGAGLVVVDTMPSVASDIGSIARQADLVLIPCRPGFVDLLSIGATIALVKQARTPAIIALNETPARRGAGEASVTVEARAALAQHGLPVVAIGHRVDLSHALGWGLAVDEFAPSSKAAAEIRALADLVEERLWPSAALTSQTSI